MKIFEKKNRFLTCIIAALVVCGFSFVSCVDDGEDYEYVIYSAYMQGTLVATIHDYSVKGTTVFLEANGVSNFDNDKISYFWDITDTESRHMWGQTIRYTFPSKDITVAIAFSAGAYDVYGLSAKKSTILIDDTFEENVILPDGTPTSSTFTDTRDNQTYQYRTIGSYDWMTQNLNWAGENATSPIGKTYKNEDEYSILYGRLYSWKEATSTANPICPSGWHVPTNTEWEDLGETLIGSAVSFDSQWQNAGSNATVNANIKDKAMWSYSPDNAKRNTEGWNALPGGKASSYSSSDNGKYGYWWSATAHSSTTAHYRYIIYNNSRFYPNYGDNDGLFLSIRCVRD